MEESNFRLTALRPLRDAHSFRREVLLALRRKPDERVERDFGAFDTSASIIVLAPILAPVAAQFGIDPVHFGTIMVVDLALGMITPPFGVNLFAACTVAKISLDRIVKQLVPFVLGCLMLITYVPPISLALRDAVYHVQK